MRVRHSGKGRDPRRAMPLTAMAAMNRLVETIKLATGAAWVAVAILAPFWLLHFMLRGLFWPS